MDEQSLDREEDAQLLSFPSGAGTIAEETYPADGAHGHAHHGAAGVNGYEGHSGGAGTRTAAATNGAAMAIYDMSTLPDDFLRLTEPVHPAAAATTASTSTSTSMSSSSAASSFGRHQGGSQPPLSAHPDHASRPSGMQRNGHGAGGARGPGATPGGMLIVTVLQAKLAKNYGISRMDPFCRLTVGAQTSDTRVCENGSKEPRWNERCTLQVIPGFTTLNVEIYDQGAFSDKLIARGEVQLDELLSGRGPYADWFPLSGQQGTDKEGQVNMHLEFRPAMYVPAPMYPHMPIGYPMAMPPSMPVGPPPMSAADVASLVEMFPGLGREVVESVLVAARGDKEAAINTLLTMT